MAASDPRIESLANLGPSSLVNAVDSLPMPGHPERRALHYEIHARPPESMKTPMAIAHLVMTTGEDQRRRSRQHLIDLLAACQLPPPVDDAIHCRVDIGPVRLRWEMHTEFVTWTFSRAGEAGAPGPLEALPVDWLAQLPGLALVALRIWVVPGQPDNAGASARELLHQDKTVGSIVAGGGAAAFSDFAIHPDGMSRMVLVAGGLAPLQVGRTVQRLLEIETYRMAGLLGLPVARASSSALAYAERELAALADAIRSADRSDEPQLLDRLTRLAGKVESQYAATQSRFTASAAYFELVDKRLRDLSEQSLGDLQTFGEFIERRLSPARSTCEWAARRQGALSQRVSRISHLLSTRVDIEQQQSSEANLIALNRRQSMQLHLQSTVEGLSVAAITYYVAGLVAYLAKAANKLGYPISPELASACSIPVAGLVIWSVGRRLHRIVAREVMQNTTRAGERAN